MTQEKIDSTIHDKKITIIVNARKKVVTTDTLTFSEVVELAFPNHAMGPDISYTVSYRDAVRPKTSGTMVEGDKVVVKDGTVFNVTKTDKS